VIRSVLYDPSLTLLSLSPPYASSAPKYAFSLFPCMELELEFLMSAILNIDYAEVNSSYFF